MRPEPPEEYVVRLTAIAATLPEVVEREAWTGTRWRVRAKTIAHLCMADHTPTFPVVTFQCVGDERRALLAQGSPFFDLDWSPTVMGMRLGPATDWIEVAELITESYRLCAPRKLARLLDQP